MRRLAEGKWAELAGAVPVSDPNARAFSYAMACHKGQPVVAVCEGVDGGRARLHVRLWKDGAWQSLGKGPDRRVRIYK